jgi:hypothetical protein
VIAARTAKYASRGERTHAVDVAERILFMVRQGHYSGAHSSGGSRAPTGARARSLWP